uniref:Uncharacterized protein n=1 Tax=Romanomermis culicivorax TaxID=13658 RepID=A0A915JCJ2_ROMCU
MALNLFGNTSMANKPTAFAFPSVPAATSSAAPSAFTFGGASATAPQTNVFGATSSAAAPANVAGSSIFSSFGQTSTAAPPPQQSLFSFGGTSAAPSSVFGTNNTMTTMSSATGFQLGAVPKFGQSTMNQPQFGGTFNFQTTGIQQQQPQQQVPAMQMNVSEIANFISSLTNPPIYGDERDGIIAKFNQLQAFCGFGKGFYSNAAAPIDYTPSNPFCRLKSICYNRLEGTKDEDGLISFIMKQPEKNIKANLQLVIDEIFKLLGSKTNISINVEATKTLPDNKTELVIYITEAGIMGVKRRILASESYAYFNQPNIRQQLTNNLAVEQVLLKTMLPLDRMNEYLSIPQDGIDLLIWNQAVAENPDPKRLIPYAILGFEQ